MTERDAELLWALQQGLPLVSEPFKAVGERFGISAGEVLSRLHFFMESGQVRRFGAVFDARRLGYRSALCAVDIPDGELVEKAGLICSHPGVTHGYERGWPNELNPDLPGGPNGRHWPNFWFTLATGHSDFDRELETLRRNSAPYDLLVLPAIKRFKIDVTFDSRTRARDERVPVPPSPHVAAKDATMLEFTPPEKALVRALEGSLPLTERPYEAVALGLGLSEEELLSKLTAWAAIGVLRRVALIVRHRNLGFTANGMCVWDVPEASMTEVGRRIAADPAVTHCYQRPRTDRFPFTLYAMIHTGEWEETRRLFVRLGDSAGLTPGQLLLSLREFKKTSMTYFA
jgi:DNA-binding Lrp family transcriptional regulator